MPGYPLDPGAGLLSPGSLSGCPASRILAFFQRARDARRPDFGDDIVRHG